MSFLFKILSRFKRKCFLLIFALFLVSTIILMYTSNRATNERNRSSSRLQDIDESNLLHSQAHPTNSSKSTNNTHQPQTIPPIATLNMSIDKQLPTIFIITPTYTRHMQKVELTRQCQTFTLVKNLYWIIIEDSDTRTALVDKLLDHCPVKSTLLNRKTSKKYSHLNTNAKVINRGAQQRNIGLEWLREHYKPGEVEGVVYFADDDNTYDVRVFEEMRFTRKVSVWPVGFAAGVLAEGPLCKDGHVTSFHSGWASYRKFPLDMAAFAVNLDVVLRNPKLILNVKGTPGYLESDFLSMITTKKELEPKAKECTEVYVWHTESKPPILAYEKKGNPTIWEV